MDSRWLALVLCAWVGCAGPTGSGDRGSEGRDASGFPKPEALYELRDRPLPAGSPFGSSHRDVESWELAGPFPEVAQEERHSGSRLWDPLLDDLVRRRAGLAMASESMQCLAREVGRFMLEHRALPSLGLQRFMAGRCAVVTAPPSFATLRWESSRTFSLAEAIDELGDQIVDALSTQVVGGPLDVGMWLHSDDAGRVELVIATGERSIRLDSVPTLAGPEGRIELTGEVLRGASTVGAVVTRGSFGWEICEAREDVALPRFHFVCYVDVADPSSWLSVHYLPPGHFLQRSGTQLLIRTPGSPVVTYRRHRYTESRPVTQAEQVPAAFLELLNQVRARAEAPPLVLAREQSRVAYEVAPHYFLALMDPEAQATAELTALGMMAGWEIDEIVQEGRFVFTWLVESRDVASLLSDALESPEARMTLLWDELEQIAIGPVVGDEGEAGYLAVMAATYRLFSEREHRRNVSLVSEHLTRARAGRGRAAARTLEALVPLTVAAASRVQAGAKPEDVLGELIQQSVDTLHRSVMGWVAQTGDLGDIVFPDEFLDRTELDIAISVSSYRPEGEAWGRYVVLMLAAEPDRRRL